MSSDKMRLKAACPALWITGKAGTPPPPLADRRKLALGTCLLQAFLARLVRGQACVWPCAQGRSQVAPCIGLRSCEIRLRKPPATSSLKCQQFSHLGFLYTSVLYQAAPEAKGAAAVVTQVRWRCLSFLAVS